MDYKTISILYRERRGTNNSTLSEYARASLIKLLKDSGHYAGGGTTFQWFGAPTPFRYIFKKGVQR